MRISTSKHTSERHAAPPFQLPAQPNPSNAGSSMSVCWVIQGAPHRGARCSLPFCVYRSRVLGPRALPQQHQVAQQVHGQWDHWAVAAQHAGHTSWTDTHQPSAPALSINVLCGWHCGAVTHIHGLPCLRDRPQQQPGSDRHCSWSSLLCPPASCCRPRRCAGPRSST